MKSVLFALAINVVSLFCCFAAFYLAAFTQNTQWGWFLFIGLICAVFPKSDD